LKEVEGVMRETGGRFGGVVKYGLNDKVLVAGEARANLGSEERPDEEEYGGFYFVNVTK